MPEGIGYPPGSGRPRTPEEGVPFLEQLRRMLPAMLGGPQSDVRLPMEVGSQRDPRLGAPSMFESIRGGLEQVRDLGRPSQEEDAMASLRKAAGVLRK